jgi:hypothetical protein
MNDEIMSTNNVYAPDKSGQALRAIGERRDAFMLPYCMPYGQKWLCKMDSRVAATVTTKLYALRAMAKKVTNQNTA